MLGASFGYSCDPALPSRRSRPRRLPLCRTRQGPGECPPATPSYAPMIGHMDTKELAARLRILREILR